MGNRAVITTRENFENDGIGIYLHWNGGRDSIELFLKYCEQKGYYSPDVDNYGFARLCQVIGNYFGGTDSLGIDVLSNLDCDNGDNGVYIIEGWKIVDREYFRGREQSGYELNEDNLRVIDKAQPLSERIYRHEDSLPIELSEKELNATRRACSERIEHLDDMEKQCVSNIDSLEVEKDMLKKIREKISRILCPNS